MTAMSSAVMDRFQIRVGQDVWLGQWLHSQNKATVLVYCLLFYYCASYIAQYLDLDLLSSLKDLSWDCLVYLTPPTLLLALEPPGPAVDKLASSQTYAELRTFAAKSEAVSLIARRYNLIGPAMELSPPGLRNDGQSCFENCTLQGLASLQCFQSFLEFTESAIPGHDKRELTSALKSVLQSLSKSRVNNKAFVSDLPLHDQFSRKEQADAGEYFTVQIDHMEREISEDSKRFLNLDRPFGPNGTGLRRTRQSADTVAQTESDQVVRNPLEGLTLHRTSCLTCNHTEVELVSFNSLQLGVGDPGIKELSRALDEFTGMEEAERLTCKRCTLQRFGKKLEDILPPESSTRNQNNYYTSMLRTALLIRLEKIRNAMEDNNLSKNDWEKQCRVPDAQSVKVRQSKQAAIARCPQALVIQFERNRHNPHTTNTSKSTAMVHYPMFFDLSAWSLGGVVEQGRQQWDVPPRTSMLSATPPSRGLPVDASRPLYVLRAVSAHRGTSTLSGHYVAYRQFPTWNPTNYQGKPEANTTKQSRKWWRCDDKSVTPVSELRVLNPEEDVVLLFYERLEGADLEAYLAESELLEKADVADSPMDSIDCPPTDPDTPSEPETPSNSDTGSDGLGLGESIGRQSQQTAPRDLERILTAATQWRLGTEGLQRDPLVPSLYGAALFSPPTPSSWQRSSAAPLVPTRTSSRTQPAQDAWSRPASPKRRREDRSDDDSDEEHSASPARGTPSSSSSRSSTPSKRAKTRPGAATSEAGSLAPLPPAGTAPVLARAQVPAAPQATPPRSVNNGMAMPPPVAPSSRGAGLAPAFSEAAAGNMPRIPRRHASLSPTKN